MHDAGKPGRRWLAVLCVVLFAACFGCAGALAGGTLDLVRKRGELRCGVADGIPGLAYEEAGGRWAGIETDFCRAFAAAALGDAERVKFEPLSARLRFSQLLNGRVDVLLANTTWTLAREAALKVRFPAILLHDGQGFLVPASSPARDPRDLADAVICVEQETTHAERLLGLQAAGIGVPVEPLLAASAASAAGDFFNGRCAALTAETASLAALRHLAGKAAVEYRILPRVISREPTGPVVRQEDAQWETIVRWVVYTLLLAEELGIDQAHAHNADLPAYSQAWGATDTEENRVIAASLGLDGTAMLRAIRAVGNYAEVFERNLGSGSPLNLERGPNRLWKDGGLMYVPPVK